VRATTLVNVALLAYRRAFFHYRVGPLARHCKRRFDLLDYARAQHGPNYYRTVALVRYFTDCDATILAPDDTAFFRESDTPRWKAAYRWADLLGAAYDYGQIWCWACLDFGAPELHKTRACLECGEYYHTPAGALGVCADCIEEPLGV
jgi:hypothetical protein